MENKALGIGMEGNRRYQGWLEPPKLKSFACRGPDA